MLVGQATSTPAKDRIRVGGVGCPGRFKVTSRFVSCLVGFCERGELGGIAVMPLAHPLACACRADSQVSTFQLLKPSLRNTFVCTVQRRGGNVRCQSPRGQGPGTRNRHPCSHVLLSHVACPQPSSNRHHRPECLPSSLDHQPTPANASQRQPTTPAFSRPPVRISERQSATDSLSPPHLFTRPT